MERVEHQLAREPEQVERPRSIVGKKRAGRGEVLAVHDLGRLVRRVLGRTVTIRESLERRVEIAELLVGITGLTQLVAARVAQRLDAVADGRVRMVDATTSASP